MFGINLFKCLHCNWRSNTFSDFIPKPEPEEPTNEENINTTVNINNANNNLNLLWALPLEPAQLSSSFSSCSGLSLKKLESVNSLSIHVTLLRAGSAADLQKSLSFHRLFWERFREALSQIRLVLVLLQSR